MSIMGRLEVGSCLVITLEGGSWSRHSLEHWPLRVLFLSSGQGLLPAVSWCSVRSSVSEDVSLMNPRREKYPTSTDSSVSCHLRSSLIISVQFNDFFFNKSTQLCRHHHDPTLEHFQHPSQSPSDHFRCFVSCIFSCQPFSFFFFLICSEFCRTLKWNSHGFTSVPHPDPPSHLPLYPLPLGLPRAPGLSACLMHPTCLPAL